MISFNSPDSEDEQVIVDDLAAEVDAPLEEEASPQLEEKPVTQPDAHILPIVDIFERENLRDEILQVEELAESIRVRGLIHPVVVRPSPPEAEHASPYELIVGYRRKAAFSFLERETIPAIVHSADEVDVLAEMITENLQRKGWSSMAEARAMQRMIDVFGWTHAEVAAHLGVHRSQVSKRLSLLELPQKVRDLVEAEEITTSHAEVLVGIEKPEAQEEMAELAARSGAPVHKLSSWAQKIKEEEDAVPEDVAEITDEHMPMETPTDLVVTPLPRLKLNDEIDAEDLATAQLYILLRSGNDVEMLEYLEDEFQIEYQDLWEWVEQLAPEQRIQQLEVMTRRWLGAAHRLSTFPPSLRAYFADGEETIGAAPEVELPFELEERAEEIVFDDEYDYDEFDSDEEAEDEGSLS